MISDDEFAYLATIPGIILGLGVVQILNGLATLLQNKRTVQVYWVHSVWMSILGLSFIHHWYALHSWRDFGVNIASYVFFMFYPITLFIASAILVPNIAKGEKVDLRAHYYSNHKFFFGMLALTLLEAMARTIFFGRTSVLAIDTGFRLLGLLVLLTLIASSNKRLHSIAALACTALLLGFMLKFSSQLAK